VFIAPSFYTVKYDLRYNARCLRTNIMAVLSASASATTWRARMTCWTKSCGNRLTGRTKYGIIMTSAGTWCVAKSAWACPGKPVLEVRLVELFYQHITGNVIRWVTVLPKATAEQGWVILSFSTLFTKH